MAKSFEFSFLRVRGGWDVLGNDDFLLQQECWEYFDSEGEGSFLVIQWGCVLEQETLTFATSTNSCVVFFICWVINTPSCGKGLSLANASKLVISVLAKWCISWVMYIWEPAAAGLCFTAWFQRHLQNIKSQISYECKEGGRLAMNNGQIMNKEKRVYDGEMS